MAGSFLEGGKKGNKKGKVGKWKRQMDGDEHGLVVLPETSPGMIYQKQCFVIHSAVRASGEIPFLTLIDSISN